MKKTKSILRYDLGCGQKKQPGYIGVDIAKIKGVDIVCDLKKFPWKFAKDNSADEIFCSHFFEHLNGEERMRFMDEADRILIKGGKINIIGPYYSSMRAVQDPTHQWPPVCEASFLYFNKGWRVQNGLDHYPIKCDYDFTFGYFFAPEWASRAEEARAFAIKHYINPIADLQVVLTKR